MSVTTREPRKPVEFADKRLWLSTRLVSDLCVETTVIVEATRLSLNSAPCIRMSVCLLRNSTSPGLKRQICDYREIEKYMPPS